MVAPSLTMALLPGLGTGLRPLDLGGHSLPANGFQVNQAFAAHHQQQQHLGQEGEVVDGGEGGASPPASPQTTPLPSPPPLRQVRMKMRMVTFLTGKTSVQVETSI